MFKKLSIFLSMIVMLACQHDEQIAAQLQVPGADIEARDGMLYFANEDLYQDKLTELERMSVAEKENWIGQFHFKPLRNITRNLKDVEAYAKDQGLEGLIPAHWLLLNENRTVQLGDDIVYYGDGFKYYMTSNDYKNLPDKRAIVNSERKLQYGSMKAVTKEELAEGRYIDAWNKGDIGWGGSQHEFGYNNMNYKFTDQWYAKTESVSGTLSACGEGKLRSRLYLQIRLDQKPTGYFQSWSSSSAERSYSYSVTMSGLTFYYGYHGMSDCRYLDAISLGPMSCPLCPYIWNATYSGYSQGYTPLGVSTPWVTTNGEILIADTGSFNGEYHATYDLKKWEGYVNSGTVTQTLRMNSHSNTDTFVP